MVEFYLLAFPRFPLRKKEHKSYKGNNRTHDFRTSRYAGYSLDHSGDERLPRETKFSGTHGDRGIFIFPVQLTTSRIGDLTRLIHTLLYVVTIHAYIHTYIHTNEIHYLIVLFLKYIISSLFLKVIKTPLANFP